MLVFQEALKGTEDVSLRWPVAVAAASDDEVAVADAFGPRLLRFRQVGVSWQLDRTVPMGAAPAGLAWDGRRYVASLRQGAGLVAFEGAELAQRRLPLPRGVVPGAMAVGPDGGLLVYDAAKRSVLRLSAEGAVTAEVAVGGDVTALAATAAGGFFAAVAAEGSVLHFDAAGRSTPPGSCPTVEQVPAWPSGLAVGAGRRPPRRRPSRRARAGPRRERPGRRVSGPGRAGSRGCCSSRPGSRACRAASSLVADEGNGRAQLFRRADPGAGR